MKREILFRGKRAVNGEWEYGFILNAEKTRIGEYNDGYHFWQNKIIPETVGQYTGLKDKYDKPIFEGDIVQYDIEESGEVIWDEQTARFVIEGDGVCYDFDNFYGKELVIIGNIHDNTDFTEDKE